MEKRGAAGVRIRVGFFMPALLALLLFTDKSGTAALFLWAVMLHELGHILWIRLSGCRITELTVGMNGVLLQVSPFPDRRARGPGRGRKRHVRLSGSWARLAADISGPAANIIAAVVCALPHGAVWIRFSAVNTALALLSLLPLAGSDGGSVCRILLERLLGAGRGAAVFRAVAAATAVSLAAAVTVMTVRDGLWLWGCLAAVAAAARIFTLLRGGE